jgi:hypothetical protein
MRPVRVVALPTPRELQAFMRDWLARHPAPS